MPMQSKTNGIRSSRTGQDFADRWAKATPGGKGARFRRLPRKKHKAVTLKAQADESQRVAAHVTTPAKSSGSTGGGYGAHAGQQIRGNLYRGADGKFHSGGAAGGAGKKASGRKSGGGSKGAKPKKSDAQKAADAAAKKAQTAADKKGRA